VNGFDPLGSSRAEWEAFAESLALPGYRGRQVFDEIHRRRTLDYARMTALPRNLRERLAREAPLALPEIARRSPAADGSVKYGLKLADGSLIEAVFMPTQDPARAEVNAFEDARIASGTSLQAVPRPEFPVPRSASRIPHSTSGIPHSRYSICLSSQTGCAVDCRFCVTGRLGAGRNLEAGEMIGQALAIAADRELPREGAHLVFMGMGEPLLNVEALGRVLAILYETISPRRITVSTSGIVPGIDALARMEKRPNLAISINAPDDATRTALMPITRSYSLADLMAALRRFPLERGRRITAEYVLIAGVNDSTAHARKLARLLAGLPVKINVIPLNQDPTHIPEFHRPEEKVIDAFVQTLAAKGITVTVRRSKGEDANAACGQLKGRELDSRTGAKRSVPKR
jgi:23S rRNA (adenine2503-C2)-methyltransferase